MSEPAFAGLPADPAPPGWLPGFAATATVMLCFLLVVMSFAEFDLGRYREVSSAFARGFGVADSAEAIPAGRGVGARAFVPRWPAPTPISERWRGEPVLPGLDIAPPPADAAEPVPADATETASPRGSAAAPKTAPDEALLASTREAIAVAVTRTRADAVTLARRLQAPIGQGQLELETRGLSILLRISEDAAFVPGSRALATDWARLLGELPGLLTVPPTAVVIHGHTDTPEPGLRAAARAWADSAARAAAVAGALLSDRRLDARLLGLSAHADTRPLAPNDSVANRARNRRVEILIEQGPEPGLVEGVEALRNSAPEAYRALGIDDPFGLAPGRGG